MKDNPLLYGLIGFLLGGLLVSVAATTFDKPQATVTTGSHDMARNLDGKTGDEFDKIFIADMIEHHQGAIDMAERAADAAKHEEVKVLSEDILATQQAEIDRMKQWQREWGYASGAQHDNDHSR